MVSRTVQHHSEPGSPPLDKPAICVYIIPPSPTPGYKGLLGGGGGRISVLMIVSRLCLDKMFCGQYGTICSVDNMF